MTNCRSNILVLVVAMVFTTAARADVSYTQTWGELSAMVTFAQDGDNPDLLLITLENISTYNVLNPTDVLTAVFFNINGATLTPVSAMLTPESEIAFPWAANLDKDGDGLDSEGGVGGEWGYVVDPELGDLVPTGATHAVSAVGLGDIVGPHDLFPGANLDEDLYVGSGDLDHPLSPGGINYGILSFGDDWYMDKDDRQGTPNVTGTEPLIWYGAIFTLSGLGTDPFDLGGNISAVAFNYGTDLNVIPAPAASLLALMGLGLVGLVTRRSS